VPAGQAVLPKYFKTVDVRQVHVEQHQVRSQLVDHRQCRAAVIGRPDRDDVGDPAKQVAVHLGEHEVVVDDQHPP
jgi:hypothetical protein